MSAWTHRICADCFIDREIANDPNDHDSGQAVIRIPTRVNIEHCPEEELCCFCGRTLINMTHGGIYVREDPAGLRCKGDHKDD